MGALLSEHWSTIGLAARDETLHALTTLVTLIALWPARRVAYLAFAGAVAGSVLIDIDHVPEVLRDHALSTSHGRPVTHSLATVAVVCLVALACSGRWRLAALSVAFGIASHLFRDIATGGVPLFWPISPMVVTFEYGSYFLCLIALCLLAVVRLMVGSRELPWMTRRSQVEPALS